MNLSALIRDFLLNDPELAMDAEFLDDDQSLIESGLIDSLAVLNLIEFLESQCEVQFDPEDLTAENFDRISSMTALVKKRMGT